MEEEKVKVKRRPVNCAVGIFIFIFIFTIGMAIASFVYYVDFKKENEQATRIAEEGRTAYAVYTCYESLPDGKGYVGVYEYEDENGVEYRGYSSVHREGSEAQRLVGLKVEILVDGKGNSIRSDSYRSPSLPLMTAISFTVAAVLTAGVAGVSFVRQRRPKRKQR